MTLWPWSHSKTLVASSCRLHIHGDGSWGGLSYFIVFGFMSKEWTSSNFRFSLTKVSYRLTIWESPQVSTVLEESSEEGTIVECFHYAVWMKTPWFLGVSRRARLGKRTCDLPGLDQSCVVDGYINSVGVNDMFACSTMVSSSRVFDSHESSISLTVLLIQETVFQVISRIKIRMEYYSHRFQHPVIVRLTCLSHCLVDDKAQAIKASIAGLLVIDSYSLIGVKGLQHTTFCSTFLAEQGTQGILDLQCQKLDHSFFSFARQ